MRHGETASNKERKAQGSHGKELNQKGKEQTESAKQYFEKRNIVFDIIYTSELQRTIQSAEIIKGSVPITVIKKAELNEQFLGSWEGRSWVDIEKEILSEGLTKEQERHKKYVAAAPDGESATTFRNRVINIVREIIANTKEEQIVLIVAHGRVLRHLWSEFLEKNCIEIMDMYNPIHNGGITKLVTENDAVKLEFVNKSPYE